MNTRVKRDLGNFSLSYIPKQGTEGKGLAQGAVLTRQSWASGPPALESAL